VSACSWALSGVPFFLLRMPAVIARVCVCIVGWLALVLVYLQAASCTSDDDGEHWVHQHDGKGRPSADVSCNRIQYPVVW
jgi:hypothetical protein